MTDPIYLLSSMLPTVLLAAALIVVGVVLGPRTGAGRGRMWTGLVVLIAVELLTRGLGFIYPLLYDAVGASGIGIVSVAMNIVFVIGFVAGVALVASAAVKARGDQRLTSYDPARPGYPAAPPAAPPGQSDQPGGSPYL